MGHVINPLSHRVGLTKFWNSTWFSTNKNAYSYLVLEDSLLQRYLKFSLAILAQILFRSKIIFTELKIVRIFKQVFLLFYIRSKATQRLYNQMLGLRQLILDKPKNTLIGRGGLLKRTTETKKIQHSSTEVKGDLLLRPTLWKKSFLNNINLPEKRWIKQTARILPYLHELPTADVNAYTWAVLSQTPMYSSATLRRSKKQVKGVLSNVIEYIFYARWLLFIKRYLASIFKKFYASLTITPEVLLVFISAKSITARFIAHYVSTKLLQRFPVRKVINSVLYQIKRLQANAQILGFRLACSGRFERRGRASYVWKTRGKIARSDVNVDVDYALALPVLINSICAVKVWVTRSRQTNKLAVIY